MVLSAFLRVFLVFVAGIALAGCELAADIFQAGMAVGVFLVIAVVALVVFLFTKVRRRI